MTSTEKITLESFEKLCKDLFAQRAKVDEMTALLTDEKNLMEEMKSKVMAFMEEHGKDKYPVQGYGLIYTDDRFTVPTPKTLEEKQAFFDYLKTRGIFLEMASVNSQTLNSFYKTELEAAILEGNSDFALPGIAEPSHVKTLRMRRE